MIRLKIREVAEAQGVKSAADLARRTGLAFAKANELWKGEITGKKDGKEENKRSVGLLTLHRIAQALDVKTSDLFEEIRPTLEAASA